MGTLKATVENMRGSVEKLSPKESVEVADTVLRGRACQFLSKTSKHVGWCFYCVFGCTDQPQNIFQSDSSTPSWSKFAIKFTMGITIGKEPKKQNILQKTISDGPSANLR